MYVEHALPEVGDIEMKGGAAVAAKGMGQKKQTVPVPVMKHALHQPTEAEFKQRTEWAASLVATIFQRCGLTDWRLTWDNRSKTRAGLCSYASRSLTLSTAFVARCPAQDIQQTLLHEVAHAVVGAAHHHHDQVWCQAAQQLGCQDDKCQPVQIMRAPFVLTCMQRCFHSPRMKRSWKTIESKKCSKCGGTLQYVANNT
jgi:predicted SprT family Zn-dependent metalloprotease